MAPALSLNIRSLQAVLYSIRLLETTAPTMDHSAQRLRMANNVPFVSKTSNESLIQSLMTVAALQLAPRISPNLGSINRESFIGPFR